MAIITTNIRKAGRVKINPILRSCEEPRRMVILKFSSKIGIRIKPINIGTVGISHLIIKYPSIPKMKTNWISNIEPLKAYAPAEATTNTAGNNNLLGTVTTCLHILIRPCPKTKLNKLATIKAAKRAGANAIKLQTYTADTLTLNVKKKDFIIQGKSIWSGQNLYDLYKEIIQK